MEASAVVHEPAFVPLVNPESLSSADRHFWMEKRRALLTELRAVELYKLGLEPSIPSKREQK